MSIALVVALFASASAAPFGEVPVQGYLTDLNGLPRDGSVTMALTLYTTDPGAPLWTDSVSVDVDQGAFTVYLGDNAPLDLALFRDNSDTRLQIGIDGETLGPIEIGFAPTAGYAAHAGDAQTLEGNSASDFRESTWVPDWSDLTSRPPGLDDGDDDTLYTAGAGINLGAGNAFSLDTASVEATARTVCFDTESELTDLLDDNYRGAGYVPDWAELGNLPADLADGDANTTYTAGSGLSLSGTQFSVDDSVVEATARSVCFDTEGELTAVLNDNYRPSTYVPGWGEITGIPAAIADGDANTTYTAGTGLNLSGTTFSVDNGTIESLARGAAYDTEAELTAVLNDNYRPASYVPAWGDLTGIPSQIADGDANTTYSAGGGVNLSGTTFSLDTGTVEGLARGVCFDSESELTSTLNDNYMPASIGIAARPFQIQINTDSSGNFRMISSDGQVDVLNQASPVPGQTRYSDNGRIAVIWGDPAVPRDTIMYFDIELSPSIACTLLHLEDDVPRAGWYFATDGGNNVAFVYPDGVTSTFMLAREGATGVVAGVNAAWRILCF